MVSDLSGHRNPTQDQWERLLNALRERGLKRYCEIVALFMENGNAPTAFQDIPFGNDMSLLCFRTEVLMLKLGIIFETTDGHGLSHAEKISQNCLYRFLAGGPI